MRVAPSLSYMNGERQCKTSNTLGTASASFNGLRHAQSTQTSAAVVVVRLASQSNIRHRLIGSCVVVVSSDDAECDE